MIAPLSPKWRIQRDILFAFFRVGLLGFGGGPSSIPLVHQEAVKKYGWMDDDEFSDTLALANAMPGPIATKMAGYVGYRAGGISGCLIALGASIIPTALMMIFLLQLFQTYKDVSWVQNMSASVIPVVAVMLALMTKDFVEKSKNTLGWMKAILLMIVSLIVMELLNIHPALLILFLIILVFLPIGKRGGQE